MFNLLKTDLKRILKDKLFLVLCIIAGVFAIITPLMNKGMMDLLEGEDLFAFNAKEIFFQSFAPGNNLGIIVPIFLGIVLCKDFSHGTVRNKIICGKSRTSIFLSMFLSCAIVMCGVMLAGGLLTLGVSLLFFKYQQTPFTAKDFGYLLATIGFEMLLYVMIAALIAFLCVSMKNVGLVIVMYVAISFLLTIIGTIAGVVVGMEDFIDNKIAYNILKFISDINVFTSKVIGNGHYGWKECAYILFPTLGGGTLFAWLGTVVFRKKDLK